MMVGMYKFMPDLHLTIEDMIAEGDKVVCRNIWRWTDTSSGKKMQFHGFVLWRFERQSPDTPVHDPNHCTGPPHRINVVWECS